MAYTKEERARYMRAYRTDRRAEIAAVVGDACAVCGSTENLEYDHIDRTTKEGKIADMVTASKDRLTDEVTKVQRLCRPCHQAKTNRECYPGRKHGTYAMYHRGRCRCDACRAAAAVRRKQRSGSLSGEGSAL